ncbi:MAG: SulP family inorganic anion transporter [Planctomycetia bacterium]|nr:SulP family inorganic anion transporter [Planctomycetia bacterium]
MGARSTGLHGSFRQTWSADLLASFVVFLVALPLCMGIAIASGAPPAAGILSGIIGGLVVATLGGSPMQVSGPANSLIAVVWLISQERGLDVLGAVVLAAGLLQLAAGLLRLGQWFRAVSPAVIHGLMIGFAAIIFASQIHVMCDDQPAGSTADNLVAMGPALERWFAADSEKAHLHAAGIGILTIVLLLAWRTACPRRLRVVPASLIAVVAATATAALLGLEVVRVQIPSDLSELVRPLQLTVLPQLADWSVFELILTVAFLASTETLLSASAVDQLHQGPRTRYDRELTAQGVGNVVCGLLGALPLTGVIIRSAANVSAGARTRLASVLHGAWLLIFVALLPFVLVLIPTSSLAAVLILAVVNLVNLRVLASWWRTDRLNLFTCLVTAGAIVFSGVLVGVAVGVALSLVKLLYKFSRLNIRVERQGHRTFMYLEGAATFIRLPKLAEAIEAVPAESELHVHIESLSYIDDACLQLLMNWQKQHEALGGSLAIDWDSLSAKVHGPELHHPAMLPRNGAARDLRAALSGTSAP